MDSLQAQSATMSGEWAGKVEISLSCRARQRRTGVKGASSISSGSAEPRDASFASAGASRGAAVLLLSRRWGLHAGNCWGDVLTSSSNLAVPLALALTALTATTGCGQNPWRLRCPRHSLQRDSRYSSLNSSVCSRPSSNSKHIHMVASSTASPPSPAWARRQATVLPFSL